MYSCLRLNEAESERKSLEEKSVVLGEAKVSFRCAELIFRLSRRERMDFGRGDILVMKVIMEVG